MAFNSNGRLITLKEAERSHRALQALFGFLEEAARNNNALLGFLGTFSASLCKLNRAPVNNKGFGAFPFGIATVKVLFFCCYTSSCLI